MATVGQVFYRVPRADNNILDKTPNIDIYKNIVTQFPSARYFTKVGIQAPSGAKVIMNGKTIMIGRTGIYELDVEGITINSLYFIQPQVYKKDETKSLEEEIAGKKGMELALCIRNNCIQDLDTFRTRESSAGFDRQQREAEIDNQIESLRTKFNGYNDNMRRILTELGELTPAQINEIINSVVADDTTTLAEGRSDIITNLDSVIANSPYNDSAYEQAYLAINDTFVSNYTNAKNKYTAGVNGEYIPVEEESGDLDNVIVDFLYE